jgi:hypothetical protein
MMDNPKEEARYNAVHAAILTLEELGPMVDATRTLISRIRVTLEGRELMTYKKGDPLYDQANQVDHELSKLLDLMMAEGIDCSPARS